ncbi:MAG TPA: hypothetical protein ENH25_10790 [candidate division Zixibacteria bacterium]|nr:hypothetical protein [candidate division Zixibacteria bacterium]
MSRNKDGFFIGITCPGCGGNLEIQSDFFVLNCSHCGSNLRIKMPEIPPAYLIRSDKPTREIRFHLDRYLRRNSLPLSGPGLTLTPIYYPYWKIDAVLLKVRHETIERVSTDNYEFDNVKTYDQKMTDIRLTSYTASQSAGPPIDFIPPSIGVRSQYSKIIPYSSENLEEDFSSLPAVKSWVQTEHDLKGSISSIASVSQAQYGKNRTKLFHPTGVIIYFPYYIVRTNLRGTIGWFILDGVTGKVINQIDKEVDMDRLIGQRQGGFEFGKLSVEFHRCHNCGVDLPNRQSHIYICDNCGDLISLGNMNYKLKGVYRAGSENIDSQRMFPFWALKLDNNDALRLKNFYGGIYGSDILAIPAFRIPNFEAMYRLSKRISAACPRLDMMPLEKQGENFAEAALSIEEALTMAEVIAYREFTNRDNNAEYNAGNINPVEVSLFYAPFHKEHYFYVDSVLGAVTFEKNLA